jgi:peptide subunit release factor 1 (eRF1)
MSMFNGYDNFVMFEPREKLNKKLYMCDKKFHLDTILTLYRVPVGRIGLVFVNGKDIKLNLIEPMTKKIYKTTSIGSDTMKLIGKTKKGGSSSGRYGRIRDNKRKNSTDKIVNLIMNSFFDFDRCASLIDILVLSGPSTLKTEVGNTSDIKKYFGDITEIYSINHNDIKTINDKFYGNLVDLKDKRIDKVKKLMITDSDKLIIGREELDHHINMCNMSEIYVNSLRLVDEIKERKLHDPEIILVESSGFLDNMGGFIGIKFY